MSFFASSFAAVFLLGSVVGCSSEPGDPEPAGPTEAGGPVIYPALDYHRTLSDLRVDEAEAYCEATQDWIARELPDAEMRKIACTMGSSMSRSRASEDRKRTCEEAYEECMHRVWKGSARTEENAASACASFATKAKTCDMTLREYESCVTEQVAQMKTLAALGKSACSDPARASGATAASPACQRVRERCPSLMTASAGGEMH
jgi:hypothetical protein